MDGHNYPLATVDTLQEGENELGIVKHAAELEVEDKERKTEARRLVSELREQYKSIPLIINDPFAEKAGEKLHSFFVLLKEAITFLETGEQKKFVSHDVGKKIKEYLLQYAENFEEDVVKRRPNSMPGAQDLLKSGLSSFFRTLNRWYVSAEDLLLRLIDKENIAEEDIGPMNLDLLFDTVRRFQTVEINSILSEDRDRPQKERQYEQIRSKNFTLEFSETELKKQLAGRQVIGNDGLVNNFLLNIFRNGLKDRIEATNVYVDAFVEGNELVLRVMNDGKGIAPKHVDLASEVCIFKEGQSATGSTGFGLTNIDKRLPSAGGKLYITSERRSGEGVITEYSATDDDLPFDLGALCAQRKELNKGDINTVWEIRLPIEEK